MWDVRALDLLLDEVIQKYNVDPARAYLTGNSMGGLGTWMLGNVAADRIAAMMPVCHGAMGAEVPVGESVKMIRLLREAGCDVRFTVDADAGRDSWTAAYNDGEFVSWLLSHEKS